MSTNWGTKTTVVPSSLVVRIAAPGIDTMTRILTLLGIFCLLAAGIYFSLELHSQYKLKAWDFAINWTAAVGSRVEISLYDQHRLQGLGIYLIGPYMQWVFTYTFNSYIGPPTTSLFMRIFSYFPFDGALLIFRVSSILMFFLAVGLVTFSLPKGYRKIPLFIGASFVFVAPPVVISIRLGQIDAWVTLAIAFSVWLASHERWKLAGFGIGLATILKVSPGILILYCLFRRKFATMVVAGTTVGIAIGMSFILYPLDTEIFLSLIAPLLSRGTILAQNHSFPAYIARLFSTESNFSDIHIDLGGMRFLAQIIAIAGVLLLWMIFRKKVFHPREFGLVVILALLAGPITWGHYWSWGVVPIMLEISKLYQIINREVLKY